MYSISASSCVCSAERPAPKSVHVPRRSCVSQQGARRSRVVVQTATGETTSAAPAGVEGLPRTVNTGYLPEDSNVFMREDGLFQLKDTALKKINPFEKGKLASDPMASLVFGDDLKIMAEKAGKDFDALYAEDKAQVDMRLKFVGLFHRPTTTYGKFMCRVRLPNGIISAPAMKYLGELIEKYGVDGCSDITTRQNIQLRGVELQDVPDMFETLTGFGITSLQSGMDNVRNIVGSPLAGVDPEEIVDTRPYCELFNDYITNNQTGHKEISNLPRKFNVAVVGTHDLYEHPHINDIAYLPAVKDGVFGWNVHVGGFFSAVRCAEAIPMDVWVPESKMIDVCHAVLTAFRDFGARQNRQKTRLMYLIEELGVEGFKAELEKRMGCTLASEGEPLVDASKQRRSYYGVNKAKDGLNFVGINVPVGRLQADDMIALAHIAETYGDGEIRLTVEQNVIFAGVADDKVADLLAQPLLQKFTVDPENLSANLVSCTGSQFCGFGKIETKATALETIEKLERELNIPTGVRIHYTGCTNTCGQVQVADIGILGTQARGPDGPVPGADIFTGGAIGHESEIGQVYKKAVPMTEVYDVVKEILMAQHGATVKKVDKPASDVESANSANSSQVACADGSILYTF